MPSTVQFNRVLRATPDRVYRAFLDPDATVKWLPPRGFTGKVHHLDARVGGTYKMSFTNFTSGKSQSFGGEYLELAPNQRIRWTDRFDDPTLPGQMTVTVTMKKVSVGTEVNIVQEGIPDAIPADACTLGWQESLFLLGNLVEAEIPDQVVMILNHLNLHVADVDEAREFFERFFNLRCKYQRQKQIAIFESETGFEFAVSNLFNSPPPAYPPDFHVGFVLEHSADVREMHERLAGAGIPMKVDLGEQGPALVFQCLGPNNIPVEVRAPKDS